MTAATLSRSEISDLRDHLDRGPRLRTRRSRAGVEYTTDAGTERRVFTTPWSGNRAARRAKPERPSVARRRIAPVEARTSTSARMGRRARNRARAAGLHKRADESVAAFLERSR
ncbi:MAG: hypothetical protein AAGA99_11640 [Actinomycetota bacterium]